MPEREPRSVQPGWATALSLQQQSVLLLAARGPDGVGKFHGCKAVVRAYRGTVLVAARYGRLLEWGEEADTFMTLHQIADPADWAACVGLFFQTIDDLPHHYLAHLMHGAQILGYKHPRRIFRERWEAFYRAMVEDLHLAVETEAQMDARLGDWDRAHWPEHLTGARR